MAVANVTLGMQPAAGTSVVVTIDSSNGAGVFTVSACQLLFTADNWAIPQRVYFSPMIAGQLDKHYQVGTARCICNRCQSLRTQDACRG